MRDDETTRVSRQDARDLRSTIRDKVKRLASDEGDCDEMRAIREQMTPLAPAQPDQTSSSV